MISTSKKFIVLISIFVFYFFLLAFGRNIVWFNEVSIWSDVVAKSPDKARSHDILGFAYSKAGLLDKAFKHYNLALAINPTHWRAHLNLGLLYFRKGELSLAEKEFLWAIDYEDSYLEYGLFEGISTAYYNLALVYSAMYKGRDRGTVKSNKELLLKSISLFKSNFSAYNNLAVTYMNEGNLDLAEKYFKQAIFFKPDMAVSYSNLGTLYADRGDYSMAMEFYNKASVISGETPQNHTNIANVYFVQKQYLEAEKYFKKAYELSPNYLPAIDGLATIYALNNQNEKAIKWFKLILKLKPDDTYALEKIYELENK